jgi:hypothetical protein
MAPTGVLLPLLVDSGVGVVDAEVVLEVSADVVVEPKLCVDSQPGSTVRRVPLPGSREQPNIVYRLGELSVEAVVEMTQV